MATTRIHRALASDAPVSRRAVLTTLAGGAFSLAAIAAVELRPWPGALPVFPQTAPVAQGIGQSDPNLVTAASVIPSVTVTHGAVSVELTATSLARFDRVTRRIRVAGHSATQSFSGISLAEILAAVGAPATSQVRITSAQTSSGTLATTSTVVSSSDAADKYSLLATHLAGRAMTGSEGAPARFVSRAVAPKGRVTRIEVLD